MARKNKNDYFEMMAHMTEYCCSAAEKLEAFMASFSPDTVEKDMADIHEIEHAGDRARHEVMEKLMREFITPIEREDIYELIQTIDDITDAIDDIPIKMYMLNVQEPAPHTGEFCQLIVRITNTLKEAMQEFHNYKKSDKLHDLIVEINSIESLGDAVYIKAIRALYTDKELNAVQKSTWKEIYECLELVCDHCEHAADAIENAVMKNS